MPRKTLRSVVCEILDTRILFSSGTLDTSFGTGGFANPFSSGQGNVVLVQSDGKTVVAGTTAGSVMSTAIARYNLNGTLDLTFGPNHNGTTVVHTGDSNKSCIPGAITEQNDGSILVAESIDNDGVGSSGLGVIRLTPQGVLDKTFDSDGQVGISIKDNVLPSSIIVDSSGKILIAGYAGENGILTDSTYGFIERLNTNGSTDSSFNGGGNVLVKSVDYGFKSVAIDQTGNSSTNPNYNTIIAAGTDLTHVMVYRFHSNGSIDTAFDGDGSATLSFPGDNQTEISGMAIQFDGKIVVSATSGIDTNIGKVRDPILARFLPSGPLDTTFGTAHTGWVKTNLGGTVDVSLGMKVSLSGNLLVLGLKAATGRDGQADYLGGTDEVLSYTANGVLDTTFASGGIAAPFATSFRGRDLAAGPGHRITIVASGGAFDTARIFDKGAMIANIYDLSPTASEAGPTSTHILVTFSERLPVSTRIYLGISGSAMSPLSMFRTLIDYHTTNIVYASILGGPNTYVDIPAGQTYVDITLTPNVDTKIEGTEQAVFTILPSSTYDIGAQSSLSIDILDNNSKTVGPTADAYVKDGASTNTNFGTAKTLLVQKYSSSNQIAYLKFDLSSVSTITFAHLKLFGSLVGGASNLVIGIFGVASTSWTETGIKNSNKPTINSTSITSATMPDAIPRWYNFDLTAYLKAQKAAGHNTVTLAVEMTASNSTYAQFNSREGTTSNTRPQLVLA